MKRIRKLFSKQSNKLIPFITAGFPTKDSTVELVLAAERAGANMVELGMPFSDPLADGPVIQKSSVVAIENGVTLSWILNQVQAIRKQSEIPLALMGYINPIWKYGLCKFIKNCADSGVDGLIVPDLPPEESKEFVQLCNDHKISPILLVAPNTSKDRIAYISSLAGDLIYCVAILGITGSGRADESQLETYLCRVRKHSSTPFVVGFGIKSHEDVLRINKLADGAVVGSALISRMENAANPVNTIETYIKELKGTT